ncbi:MAG: preprotein translocase subunit SecE [Pseudomonadota bacterium]
MAKKNNPGSRRKGAPRKKRQTGAGAAAGGGAETIDAKAEEVGVQKKSTSPLEFFSQVRAEAGKVTWTSRNETVVSTVMVLIMVMIMSLFFFLVDQALRAGVGYLLSLGG